MTRSVMKITRKKIFFEGVDIVIMNKIIIKIKNYKYLKVIFTKVKISVDTMNKIIKNITK